MSRRRQILSIGVVAAVLCMTAAVAHVTVFPKGTTLQDLASVQLGYVVYGAPDGDVYAVDVDGRVRKTWSSPDPGVRPGVGYAEPISGSNLLVFLTGEDPIVGCGVNCGRVVAELDVLGNKVWEYVDEERLLHHDFERLPTGDTLILCSVDMVRPEISDKVITDDCLMIVDPAGEVIWFWQTADHFDELDLSDEARSLIREAGGDWAHANSASAIPPNTSHANPALRAGNLIVSYRQLNAIIIIDHVTGEIVWQMHGRTVGQHDVQMIPDSLPGGGDLLLFDNGGANGYPLHKRMFSRVLQMDPSDGTITWEYRASDSGRENATFFSANLSSVQRLPNGNTLVVEGATGRIFELTESKRIVWEFVNPVVNLDVDVRSTSIYRARKVTPEWLELPQ